MTISHQAPVLFGCRFDPMTMSQVVEECLGHVTRRGTARVVATVNVALLVMMRSDPELCNAFDRADLSLADGKPVIWMSRLFKKPLPERVPGVDLMQRLMEAGAERRLRVYFLGARPAVVAKLARLCQERYPGLQVAGCRHGYFRRDEWDAVAADIRAAQADVLFIGMPSPFKEVWAEEYRNRLGVPLILGVGGSFDVVAGRIRRAPRWMQEAGLEWFWRLLMEPRKLWRRYLGTNARFAGMVMRELVGRS